MAMAKPLDVSLLVPRHHDIVELLMIFPPYGYLHPSHTRADPPEQPLRVGL
jgi:hypothetical protein